LSYAQCRQRRTRVRATSMTDHLLNRRFFFRGSAALAIGSLATRAASAQSLAASSAPPTDVDATRSLDTLSSRALRWSSPDPANWVRPRAGVDHNVVIVGAGHSGLGIGYGLKRKGVGSAVIIDQAESGLA